MIFFLIDFLEKLGVHVPSVFLYTSTRMILAAMTTLVVCIFFGPYFIRKLYEMKIGQPIRKEECPLLGELHAKKQDTPTMGGALLIFGMLVSLFLWMDWTHVFTLILFLTTIVLGSVGGYDDYLKLKYKNTKGLSGKKKLLIQGTLATALAVYFLYPGLAEMSQCGSWFCPPVVKENRYETVAAKDRAQLSVSEYASRVYVPFYKEPIFLFSGGFALLGFAFCFFVIAGSSNAVNLTDGLDGLAAGCVLMVAACLSLIAFLSNHNDFARYLNILYIEGSGEIAVYLSALFGACLGFLWYNGHPAQVFMGDIGSLTLGGIIGVSAFMLKRELLLVILGGIFVAEAVSVILQVLSYRYRNKKRVFLCAPLHHHYEYKGWPETKVVIRFWIIALLLALIGIASLKFQ